MTNTKDWEIDTSFLADHKKSGWTDDYFSETADGKYGVYIHSIDEWRMMSYAGLIAIYSDKENSKPLINSSDTWVWFDNEKTFDYAPLTDCFIFRKPAYNKNSNRPDFPFILIKPTEKTFGFIEWDATSIYYGFNEVDKDKLIIKEVHPKDLENLKRTKRTNEIIDLATIDWFSIKHFDKALNIYHREMKNPVHNSTLQKAGRTWWKKLFGSE
ncbi:hypothetical protein [Pedobacter sp. ASV28]|uniref:hypothetical protein n=1 Tax=Pedobacter sp. ASV28 TaxID=2795123 RepID=UPI0018ED3A11|nr:hypothetical protein [Pedobacter sp. ASV28]